ncbi:MAG: hypothetical protein GKS05_11835 [Nitrospirales bacterium]|nr:hypothetical protein [Nitrospirales bacterium]
MQKSIQTFTQRVGMISSLLCVFLLLAPGLGIAVTPVDSPPASLQRAKIYLAVGDYRRAVEACQRYLDRAPSVEGYVYLTYVYHAIDGYLSFLAKHDEWGKVGQLALGLFSEGTRDIVDPPDMLSRMAKELIHEGLRQQFDLTAAMANRLDRSAVDRLWQELADWKEAHPQQWWASVPPQWGW